MAKEAQIIVIDDEETDIFFFESAMHELDLKFSLKVFDDAEKAFKYLNDYKTAIISDQKDSVEAIDLIFVDINMPKINGFELLKHLKADTVLCVLPIIILSGSDNPHDVEKSYSLGANGYITKPVRVQDYADSLHKLIDFGLSV